MVDAGHLYGEDDLTEDSAPRIAEAIRIAPSGSIRSCAARGGPHRPLPRQQHYQFGFSRDERPDLLRQDLDFTRLADPVEFPRMALETGVQPTTLAFG